MKFNAGCSKWRLAVLAVATSLLTGCATTGFEAIGLAACPPVVEYNREFQARVAEEPVRLPEGSMIAEMLSDYAVMRGQARACVAKYPSRRSVASRIFPVVLQL